MLCVQDVLSLEKQRVGGTKRDRKTKKVFLSSYSSSYRNFVFNAMQDFFGLFFWVEKIYGSPDRKSN